MEQKLVNFSLPPAPLDEPETVSASASFGSGCGEVWCGVVCGVCGVVR